jgi:hypothetical protein
MKTPLVSLFLVAWLGSNGLSTGNAQSAPVAAPRCPCAWTGATRTRECASGSSLQPV